jgi:ABC-type polysaccharide/polyol phosphate transport system ATPase subunit
MGNFILFIMGSVLCIYLLAIFELKIHKNIFRLVFNRAMECCIKNYPQDLRRFSLSMSDYDVTAERNLISSLSPAQEYRNYNLIVKNLTKHYGKVLAVNQINFALRPGECLGLLGANGAGKTSIIKMLTGETEISAGNVYFGSLNKVHKKIGYCPQFDALFENLTGWEILKFYSLCRGSN